MSETTGAKLTKSEFFDIWEEREQWSREDWDYAEWEECIYAWETYKKTLDNVT